MMGSINTDLAFFVVGTFGDSHLNSTKYYVANGCPRKFDWCHDTPQIWLPQFILGAILFSFGYSSCLGLFVSLYTKLVSSKNKVWEFFLRLYFRISLFFSIYPTMLDWRFYCESRKCSLPPLFERIIFNAASGIKSVAMLLRLRRLRTIFIRRILTNNIKLVLDM